MKRPNELERENEVLRDRLARLSEASLRITEDLDFNSVLQGVLDSARSPEPATASSSCTTMLESSATFSPRA